MAPNATTPVVNETVADNSTIVSTTPLTETRIAVHEIINHPFRTMGTIVHDSWTRWNAGEPNTWVKPDERKKHSRFSIFGHVFRGQVLSIVLAAVIVSIILIREWMTQHNWDVQAPKQETEEGPIDPSEWTFKNGVAYPIATTGATSSSLAVKPTSPSHLRVTSEHDCASARERIRNVMDTDRSMDITIADLEIIVINDAKFADALKAKGVETDFDGFDKSKTVAELMTEHIGDIVLQYRLCATLGTLRDLPGFLRKDDTETKPAPIHDEGHDTDGWEDDDGEEEPSEAPIKARAGPSTQPARPCNADKEGYEKEVSYAAPELINEGPSRKGKGKATDQADDNLQFSSEVGPGLNVTDNNEAARSAASTSDQLARSTSNKSAIKPPEISRNQSFSSQPSQSEGRSDAADASPTGPLVQLPDAEEAEVIQQAVRDVVEQDGRRGDAPAEENAIAVAPPADFPADLEDPDDAPLDIDDWEGLLEGESIMCYRLSRCSSTQWPVL